LVLVCGCSRDTPPKNHAVRNFPSAEAMEKWTDFSGEYIANKLTDGSIRNRHKGFVEERWLRSNANLEISQHGSTNIVVVYETLHGSLLTTNTISLGKRASPWGGSGTMGKQCSRKAIRDRELFNLDLGLRVTHVSYR